MSAETVDSQVHLVDQNPIANVSDEVDLSKFHDVCRKILAKQIPSGSYRVKLEKEKTKERKKASKNKVKPRKQPKVPNEKLTEKGRDQFFYRTETV